MIASEIQAKAGEMVGDMPREVREFLNGYSPPSA